MFSPLANINYIPGHSAVATIVVNNETLVPTPGRANMFDFFQSTGELRIDAKGRLTSSPGWIKRMILGRE